MAQQIGRDEVRRLADAGAPSVEAGALRERMRRAGVDAIVVTRSDGTLLGLFEAAGDRGTTPRS